MIITNGRNIWPQDLEHIAVQQPEVRSMEVSAFSITGQDGKEEAVMVVQCRINDANQRADLIRRLQRLIHGELGIHCSIELVPPHTLPRTSPITFPLRGQAGVPTAPHGGRCRGRPGCSAHTGRRR